MRRTSLEGDYLALLAQFPLRRQGVGVEPTFPGRRAQPMTYALVTMAECRRAVVRPTEEGVERIRRAVGWLIRNRDLDRDGLVGWGLPDAWDAFGDGIGAAGTRNPPNHPYTITTAFVLNALADARDLGIWTPREARTLGGVAGDAVRRWCRDAFTQVGRGGFFWYSTFRGDAHYCPNVSAFMLSAVRRWGGDAIDGPQPAPDGERIDDPVERGARHLVQTVHLEDGEPFWNYVEPWSPTKPNDAVHHAYVIWSMELYRETGGTVPLPWTTEQAVASLERFRDGPRLIEMPRRANHRVRNSRQPPMRVWGAGMCLAVLARYGPASRALEWHGAIRQAYGPPPEVTLRPSPWSVADRTYYHRYVAHLLYGLAELTYGGPETRVPSDVGGTHRQREREGADAAEL